MPPVRGGSSWRPLPTSTLNPLILVAGECPLIVRQVREKSEPPDAICSNSVTVNDDRAVEQLAQVCRSQGLAGLMVSAVSYTHLDVYKRQESG